jgi:GGDEF domain-containing protein
LGDRTLQFFARALRAAARVGVVVGRQGGEEFCVFMSQVDKAAASLFDGRVRDYPADAACTIWASG